MNNSSKQATWFRSRTQGCSYGGKKKKKKIQIWVSIFSEAAQKWTEYPLFHMIMIALTVNESWLQ